MKKTVTVAALVFAGSLLCSAASAGESASTTATGFTSAAAKAKSAPRGKTTLAQALKKKHFLYLDMVQRIRPEAIRNAVIVYDHPFLKKPGCSSVGKTSVSECWLGPVS